MMNRIFSISTGAKISCINSIIETIPAKNGAYVFTQKTHQQMTPCSFFPDFPGVKMGVSLNGGTPKTPQNDHF